MSLGNLGASIIRENVILLTTSSNDNSLKIMKAGHRINAIFMVCRIKYFESILECLEEDAIVYINKVVKIVHECVHHWDGAINKNEGDLYLITWKLPNVEENENEKNENLQEMKTELADKSLIAAVKVIAELRRAGDLKAYYKNPRLSKDILEMSNNTCVTFALHQGWTIEGVIGSELKIDALYLSPQIAITYRIEQLCKYYDMPILVTESLYSLMSLKARNSLRKIDVITMKESVDPRGIYAFDICYPNLERSENIPEDHKTGELIKLAQYKNINIEGFKDKEVDYMFTLDSDIVEAQSKILEFTPIFRQAFKSYISGEWNFAYDHIERCLECWEDDGPTKAIQLYLSAHQYVAPDAWNGHRNIDDDLNKIYKEKLDANNHEPLQNEKSKEEPQDTDAKTKDLQSTINKGENQSADIFGMESRTATITSNFTES